MHCQSILQNPTLTQLVPGSSPGGRSYSATICCGGNQIGEGWLDGQGLHRSFNNGSLMDQKFRDSHGMFAMTAVGAGAIANDAPGLEGEVE